MLLQRGVNVNEQNSDGTTTPLLLVAIGGHCEVVKCLLENGGDVNFEGERGLTALHGAILANSSDTVGCLLSYNINTDYPNSSRAHPLQLCDSIW